jgi:phenylalanyl-tRNA synthetase beta chain
MKVSLSWVREFTDVDVSADELVTLATERLGGIEGVTNIAQHYDGIVVAKVVSCEKHPNADRLNICKVEDNGVTKDVQRDKDGLVQVVCGAPNVRPGLMVAWIPPGSAVPASMGDKEPFVLEARDIRGEYSNGMLASPHELAVSDDHGGILEIEDDVKPGTPFVQLYGLDDTIIEIENKMFTHRPDCFGQLGVAREIAGIQHKAFGSPAWYEADAGKSEQGDSVLTVDNQIPELCPRYTAVVIEGVKVAPSPLWLQSYLKRVGIRPINNVVDITNYMMILTAQPLHAFDFDKVAQGDKAKIIVRKPHDGEEMTLLDGKHIKPHAEAVLICNPDGPIALGGVMGGGNSEVSAETTKIILEGATFDMYSIRRTSMEHGLFTDAVTRFNKGQPAAQLTPVMHKALEMFADIAGGKQAGSIVDSHPDPVESSTVTTTQDFINARLGSDMSSEDIAALLRNVEFDVQVSGDEMTFTAPFWRTDIEIPEDIVEEIGRLYGFNQLPVSLPVRTIRPVSIAPLAKLSQAIRQNLSSLGANEVQTYSFVHGNLLDRVGQSPDHAYGLKNALSPDLQYYRMSLVPSLLDKVHANVKAGFDEFALFEIGKTHIKGIDDDEGLPKEFNRLGFVIAESKPTADTGAAFFDAKHYLTKLLDDIGISYSIEPVDFELTQLQDQIEAGPYELSRTAYVRVDNAIAGFIGELKPSARQKLKLPEHTAAFEIDLSRLCAAQGTGSSYTPISKYPSTSQDITLRVDRDVSYAKLDGAVSEALEACRPHDVVLKCEPQAIYVSDDGSTQNITFRITATSNQRTLETKAVNLILDDTARQLAQSINAERV